MGPLKKLLFGSQLRRNVFSGSFITALQVVLMAISFPVYLHFLGYSVYGLWLVGSTVLTLSQLGNLGLSQALMKLVAEHHAKGDKDAVESYVSTGMLTLVGMGALISLAVLACRGLIISGFALTGDAAVTARWLFPLIAVLSGYVLVCEALYGTLAGLGRMDLANYCRVTGRLTTLIASVTQLSLGGGVESLLIGNLAGCVATHLAYRTLIRRIVRVRFFSVRSFVRSRLKALVSLGLPSVASLATSLLLVPFNNLMLSRYVGLHAVPIFEMGHRVAMEVRGVLATGLSALVPEVSSLSAQGAGTRIVELNRRARRLILSAGGLLYGAMLLGASVMLHLWLRSRYVEPLALVFRIALLGSFASLLGVPAYYSMLGVGRPTVCLRSHLVQSLTNVAVVTGGLVVTGSLTIPWMAVAIASGYALSTVYLLFATRLLIA